MDWGKELCVKRVDLNDQLLFPPYPTWFYEKSTFEVQPYSSAVHCRSSTFIEKPQETEKTWETLESIEQTWSVDVTEKQMRKQSKRMRKLQKQQRKTLGGNGFTNGTDIAPLTSDNGCGPPTFLAARGVQFDSKSTISESNIYPTGTKLVLRSE